MCPNLPVSTVNSVSTQIRISRDRMEEIWDKAVETVTALSAGYEHVCARPVVTVDSLTVSLLLLFIKGHAVCTVPECQERLISNSSNTYIQWNPNKWQIYFVEKKKAIIKLVVKTFLLSSIHTTREHDPRLTKIVEVPCKELSKLTQ